MDSKMRQLIEAAIKRSGLAPVVDDVFKVFARHDLDELKATIILNAAMLRIIELPRIKELMKEATDDFMGKLMGMVEQYCDDPDCKLHGAEEESNREEETTPGWVN